MARKKNPKPRFTLTQQEATYNHTDAINRYVQTLTHINNELAA